MPNPTISPRIFAPRAFAESSASSVIMAPPSPRINPRRSLENGRHVSVETTRIASQALRMPMLNIASLPPVMARSADPCRMAQNACPIAWLAEEQAVEMV